MRAAWKQALLWLELSLGYPASDDVTRLLGDFKLDWPLGLALHDDSACCNLTAVGNILDT